MQLDWKLRFMLLAMRLTTKRRPFYTMTPQKARQLYALKQSRWTSLIIGSSPTMYDVAERTITGRSGDIPVRIYRPTAQQPAPLVVFYHGGGFVLGDLNSHDMMCRRIAQSSGAIVLAVDYRLAPEHPYPAAVEDAYDALCWAAEHGAAIGADTSRIAVAGDSAGGNLAAAVSLMARDLNNPRIALQVLIYPPTTGVQDFPSRLYSNAPVLDREEMMYFGRCYLTEETLDARYFSVLDVDDLSGLPPALVILAQYDLLHDEGLAYAERLRDAGNEVEVHDYERMIHAFLSFPNFAQPAADAAYAAIGQALKRAFGKLARTH